MVPKSILVVCAALVVAWVDHVMAQENARHDALFVTLPYPSDFQSIELVRLTENEYRLFAGYDEGTTGVIIEYICREEGGTVQLVENGRFTLPAHLDHPNDLLLRGDSLLVVGWSRSRISYLAWLNVNTGTISGWIIDTVAVDWWLQDAFIHNDTLYRVLTNSVDVLVQKREDDAWSSDTYLTPSPYHSATNFIQGVKVVLDRYLLILTSFPTRLDIFEIPAGFRYVKSIYLENIGEAEGLTVVERDDGLDVYYGLTQPNRIRRMSLRWNEIPEPVYPKGLQAPYDGPVRFDCYPVNGASSYLFRVYDQDGVVVVDTTAPTSWIVLEGLQENTVYRWNVAIRLFNDSTVVSGLTVFSLVRARGVTRLSTTLPSTFVVNQNFPNPFNAQTRVRFSVPEPSYVRVAIFDIVGRLVNEIFSKFLQPGVYDVSWLAANERSGCYVVEVTAGNQKRNIIATLIR